MSVQRRRGIRATVYPEIVVYDSLGEPTIMPDLSNPQTIRAAFIPQRSAKAEAAGQVEIDVVRMIYGTEVKGMGLWARVHALGKDWDVVTPPAYHHGTRRVRHYSADLRGRPASPDEMEPTSG